MSFHGLEFDPKEPVLLGAVPVGLTRFCVEFDLPDGTVVGSTTLVTKENLSDMWSVLWEYNVRKMTQVLRRHTGGSARADTH